MAPADVVSGTQIMATHSTPMQNSSKMHLVRAAMAVALLAIGSPLAFSQLYSRPATVVLIARLESLSVSAAPAGMEAPPAQTASPLSPSIAFTASWVVRSNLTTLRLVGYLAPDPEASDEPDHSSPRNSGPAISVELTNDAIRRTGILEPGGAGVTLLAEASGDTNAPKTRTGNLSLGLDKTASAPMHAERHSGTLDIRMQAL